jgi:hypothetical protein
MFVDWHTWHSKVMTEKGFAFGRRNVVEFVWRRKKRRWLCRESPRPLQKKWPV